MRRSKQSKVTTYSSMRNPVPFYLCNIVDYGRIISAVISFFFMQNQPIIASLLYAISVLLDTIDGELARRYNQCSMYGCVMDMVIDRCSTMSLQIALCVIYPKLTVVFQILASLDISSHWAHMYYTLIAKKESHKIINTDDFKLLQFYYKCRAFMTTLIIANEGFFLCLYAANFFNGNSYRILFYHNTSINIFTLLATIFFPFTFLKQFINIQQIISAMRNLAQLDWMSKKNS